MTGTSNKKELEDRLLFAFENSFRYHNWYYFLFSFSFSLVTFELRWNDSKCLISAQFQPANKIRYGY